MGRPSTKDQSPRTRPILPLPLSVDDVSKVRHGSGEVVPASELETKFPYPRSQTAAGTCILLGWLISIVNLNGLEITQEAYLWVCLGWHFYTE